MNKTFVGASITCLAISVTLGRCFFAPPTPDGEPLPVVVNVAPAHVAATPTATPTATMQPISAPVRVNFASGSYGETLAGDTGTAYLLWAAAGQTFTTTLLADSTALASLYAPDGVALYQGLAAGYTAKATLPANGDYRLEIRSSGSYTVEVMIE
jgi:hypothetical protein